MKVAARRPSSYPEGVAGIKLVTLLRLKEGVSETDEFAMYEALMGLKKLPGVTSITAGRGVKGFPCAAPGYNFGVIVNLTSQQALQDLQKNSVLSDIESEHLSKLASDRVCLAFEFPERPNFQDPSQVTMDASRISASLILAKDNLTVSREGVHDDWGMVATTDPIVGRAYWEIEVKKNPHPKEPTMIFGVVSGEDLPWLTEAGVHFGKLKSGVGWASSSVTLKTGSTTPIKGDMPEVPFESGTKIGIFVDTTGDAITMQYFVNGSHKGSRLTLPCSWKSVWPAICMREGGQCVHLNFKAPLPHVWLRA